VVQVEVGEHEQVDVRDAGLRKARTQQFGVAPGMLTCCGCSHTFIMEYIPKFEPVALKRMYLRGLARSRERSFANAVSNGNLCTDLDRSA
jgi:hypothetical protein